MGTNRHVSRILRVVLLVLLATFLVTWISWESNDSSHRLVGIADASGGHVKSNHKRLTARQLIQRNEFWASRQGVQFGVPVHALADAAAQVRSSEMGISNASGSLQFQDVFGDFSGQPSSLSFAPAWTFIGPQPIQEKANFVGSVFGNNFAATGRITSIAVDPTGLIVVGAEVVNGTGDVGLRFEAEPVPGIEAATVDFTLTPGEALDFAKLLSRQAHEAMRAKWNESNINRDC